MFTSLLPGLVVAAVAIVVLRIVLGFLVSPPRKRNFGLKARLIRCAAYWSLRIERLWKN